MTKFTEEEIEALDSIPVTIEQVRDAEIQQANREIRRMRKGVCELIRDLDKHGLGPNIVRDRLNAITTPEDYELRSEWDHYKE